MWPEDVTVETGVSYESVIVHARWLPAPSSDPRDPRRNRPLRPCLPSMPHDAPRRATFAAFSPRRGIRRIRRRAALARSRSIGSLRRSPRPSRAAAAPPRSLRRPVRHPPRCCDGDVSVESATEDPRIFVDTGDGTATFGSVCGAKMAAPRGDGDLRAGTLTADAVLDTDGWARCTSASSSVARSSVSQTLLSSHTAPEKTEHSGSRES
jgi:hypothetical protein